MRPLCHPNVLRMHNFDIDPEHHCAFIVMEHLPGPTLDRVLGERPLGLSLSELREIALPLLDALAHAHQRGVLHGDIKPGNVMLSETGVRLFDFGLGRSEAGVLKGLAPLSRTHFGAWPPGYAAPELLAGAPGPEKPRQLPLCFGALCKRHSHLIRHNALSALNICVRR
ncbi:hypothetical protein Pfra02_01040 [Pseudomonas fragi]|nr:hypothetical protein Pfra02_01040 [Pseudomonas fragi]